MFKKKVIQSFRKARSDLETVRHEQKMIKLNANEWIQYLKQQDSFLKARIDLLEKKVQKLESERELRAVY